MSSAPIVSLSIAQHGNVILVHLLLLLSVHITLRHPATDSSMELMNIPSSVKFIIYRLCRYLFAEGAVVTTSALGVGEAMTTTVEHLGRGFCGEVLSTGHRLAFASFAE